MCSSAKKYAGYVSGYALAVCRIGDVIAYYDDFDNLVEYGWQIKRLRFIKPFPVKEKLHFFDVDDSRIEMLKGMSFSSWKTRVNHIVIGDQQEWKSND